MASGVLRLLPDLPEVGDVLRRDRILQEEELERLDVLGELDGLARRDPLVDVVQQFDLVAQLLAALLAAS